MENVVETGKKIRRAAKNGGEAGRDEWKRLVADVEDLVKKVANVDDAEIAEIRSKVEHTLADAKVSAGAGIEAVREHAEDASEATDHVRSRESLGRDRHRRGGRNHHRFRCRAPLSRGPRRGPLL